MKYIINFYFTFLLLITVRAQDTVSVMAYNILNYSSTNSNKTRYNDLKIIINHVKPDIVLLSEVADDTGAKLLLDSAFNVAGVGTYSRSIFINGFDTDNSFYYKTSKIKLVSQKQIATSLRDISQYYVYYLLSPLDTAWLYLHSAHLKASSSVSDENQRNSEVINLCNSISAIPQTKNILFAGDFNLYGNTEPAWATLTSSSCSHKFYDPINQSGPWNANSAYKFIHTQSTRSSSNPGCCGGSTGGLDDRFDFILTNGALINGTSKMQVIPSLYKAIGNDGNHFNLSINSAPANSSVPATVATALFNMSDHLPVFCKFKVSSLLNSISENDNNASIRIFVSSDSYNSQLYAIATESGKYNLSIYNSIGAKIIEKDIFLQQGSNDLKSYTNFLENGVYIAILEYKGIRSSCLLPLRQY